jgi:integrase
VERKRHGLPRLESNAAVSVSSRRRRRNGKTRKEAARKAFSDDELRRIWAAAQKHISFFRLMRLVSYTVARHHDVRAMRWSHVDLEAGLWEVKIHKTSDETGAAHIVPLTTQARAVLGECLEANMAAGHGKSPWVFPERKRGKRADRPPAPCEVCGEAGHADKNTKPVLAIKAEVGLGGRGILHRLRDSFSTRAGRAGKDRALKEACLSHVVATGIEATYDHSQFDEEDVRLEDRRALLQWWCDTLDEITAKGLGEASEGTATG